MRSDPDFTLAGTPNPLAPDYTSFRVSERLLLSGHSHQAWPDIAQDGLNEAWTDAAHHVDHKWAAAFAKAERVKAGFRALLGDPSGCYSLAGSTHAVLVRWLSALPLDTRPKLVVTTGEFHAMRRQLQRVAEAGIEVVWVRSKPEATVAERLAAEVDDRTAAALTSTVFFQTGAIAGDLSPLTAACRTHGAALLLDTYHQLGAVPFSLEAADLLDAYVVGGGYKYLQLGEGNCFLRWPADSTLRPIDTGWFAEFGLLASSDRGTEVPYGTDRFAGSTYDPISHYRAGHVFDFFADRGLSPTRLRAISLRQVGRLTQGFEALGLDPSVIDYDHALPSQQRAGFLAMHAPQAQEICAALNARDVWCDARGTVLRFGPAPYLNDDQLDAAIAALGEVVAG